MPPFITVIHIYEKQRYAPSPKSERLEQKAITLDSDFSEAENDLRIGAKEMRACESTLLVV